jgi:hypothetical protein
MIDKEIPLHLVMNENPYSNDEDNNLAKEDNAHVEEDNNQPGIGC